MDNKLNQLSAELLTQLEVLADDYMRFLSDRQSPCLKQHLSLDFITRQKVAYQIKLISQLPAFTYGVGRQVVLFENYEFSEVAGQKILSPFQFDVCFQPVLQGVEEKITITLHQIIWSDVFRIQAIVSDAEVPILEQMVKKHLAGQNLISQRSSSSAPQ